MQVITNGYFSLDAQFVSYIPHRFPLVDQYLLAPFWSDVDITNGVGTIQYEVHSRTTGGTPLQDVSEFISNEGNVVFEAEWMLVAEWREVPQWGTPTSVVNLNTYQSHKTLYVDGVECIFWLYK